MREAVSLALHNTEVKAAFSKIQQEENTDSLLKLCQKLVRKDDIQAGEEAVRYLDQTSVQLPQDVGRNCLELLLDYEHPARHAIQDAVIAGLLRQSSEARAFLASRLEKGPLVKVFNDLYGVGDRSLNGLMSVILDDSTWPSVATREEIEKDVFRLLLAKLIEAGHEHHDRALNGIARLLTADAERLQLLIDTEILDVILSHLDTRQPVNVRSQATLAIVKYMEVCPDKGQTQLSNFITSRVTQQTDEDLIIAFSVAAAVFPIVPSIAAELILTEGFTKSLVPLIRTKAKNGGVERAALELLSAACIDRACRDAVSKHCLQWLQEVFQNGEGRSSELAAVILAKVKGEISTAGVAKEQKDRRRDSGIDELVGRFRSMMTQSDQASLQSSIEGLAYTSLQPNVKEQLANDRTFLRNLFTTIIHNSTSPTLIFGGLNVVINLTKYLPNLSEEQKKMSQLKAYANTSKAATTPDPFDEESHVTKRCTAVLEAGVVPILVGCAKKVSSTALSLILDILLSLSRTPKHRGTIAQQGGVKLLISAYSSVTGTNPAEIHARRTAAHALARILISVDPSLVFSSSGTPQRTSAIRPLLSPLSTSEDESIPDQPRDLLPTFEAFLALTNLASTPDTTVSDTIIRLAWPTIEDLLLSNNTLVQRASVELVCNLMLSPSGVAKFADGTQRAGQRLHILLALADVEDFATRRAAGGALAMLTEYETVVGAILERDRGIEILLGLCGEGEEEVIHRGVVCIRNIICAGGEVGVKGRNKAKEMGGVDILKAALKRARNEAILEIGVEALKELIK